MKNKLKWLNFFVTEKNESEDEQTLKEKVSEFIRTFKYQSAQYKIVWIIRILCWALIFGVAVFGFFLRIAKYFK